jgi:hypothetical protein
MAFPGNGVTGRDEALSVGPKITASPANAKPRLKKQEKNTQDPLFFRGKPGLWSGRFETIGDHLVQVSG